MNARKTAYLKHYLFGSVLGVLSLLLLAWGLPRLVALYSESRIAARQEINKFNDGHNYAIHLSSLLGSEWYDDPVYVSDEQEDAAGWDGNIAGSVEWTARNDQAYVNYTVFTYTDSQLAQQRYDLQTQWVIELDSGVPVSRQLFSYESVEISTPLQADDYQIACQNILGEQIRCAGLFLYGNHVAYLDSFRVKDGEEFLSIQSLEAIFSAIDQKLSVQS